MSCLQRGKRWKVLHSHLAFWPRLAVLTDPEKRPPLPRQELSRRGCPHRTSHTVRVGVLDVFAQGQTRCSTKSVGHDVRPLLPCSREGSRFTSWSPRSPSGWDASQSTALRKPDGGVRGDSGWRLCEEDGGTNDGQTGREEV